MARLTRTEEWVIWTLFKVDNYIDPNGLMKLAERYISKNKLGINELVDEIQKHHKKSDPIIKAAITHLKKLGIISTQPIPFYNIALKKKDEKDNPRLNYEHNLVREQIDIEKRYTEQFLKIPQEWYPFFDNLLLYRKFYQILCQALDDAQKHFDNSNATKIWQSHMITLYNQFIDSHSQAQKYIIDDFKQKLFTASDIIQNHELKKMKSLKKKFEDAKKLE